MSDFVKLSELVGSTFTVQKVWGYKYKKWDDTNKKMLISETYQEGFRKLYDVDTDKGKLDLSSGQLGTLLEIIFSSYPMSASEGNIEIVGKTFEVKSNGKSGMDIRYFFNEVREVRPLPDKELNGQDPEEQSLMDTIPF